VNWIATLYTDATMNQANSLVSFDRDIAVALRRRMLRPGACAATFLDAPRTTRSGEEPAEPESMDA